ncbi:MAG: histidinol-phosphate transaminase [Desertimonas sp.]
MSLVPERDDLRALSGYHSPQVDVEVRLNANESPYPVPAAWRDAFAAAVADVAWERYPDRAATGLRGAIADWHGVNPGQVFAANGSNEVLQTVLLAYAGFGRRVVTFEPTYQLHGHIARITGAEVVEGERGSDFALDADLAADLVSATKPAVTFLCSPNNPTGRVESPAIVDRLLDAGPGLLVVDEAYAQFAGWSALDLVAAGRPLCVVRTFSKTWSMAGLRLGYLVGPDWLVETLDKVVLPYHLDAAKQLAGTLALRYVDEMDDRVAAIVAERERLVERLARLDVDVVPSGANFVLFRPRRRRGHDVWEGLVAHSVLVRDCSGWPRLADCLRVTIGTPDENDRFIQALAQVLATPSLSGSSPPRSSPPRSSKETT